MLRGALKVLLSKNKEKEASDGEALSAAELVADNGADIEGFGDNAIVIADVVHGHLNTAMGVDFEAVLAQLKNLTYAQGAAVYAAFGSRPYTILGFTMWSGTMAEWLTAADSFTLQLGGTNASDVFDQYEYLAQNGING